MVKIRLARMGKKNQASFRIVVSDALKDTQGPHIESLGYYNPSSDPEIEINKERALYWLSQGAQPSPTVHNILVDQGVLEGGKVKASKSQKKKDSEKKVKDERKEEKGNDNIAEEKSGINLDGTKEKSEGKAVNESKNENTENKAEDKKEDTDLTNATKTDKKEDEV